MPVASALQCTSPSDDDDDDDDDDGDGAGCEDGDGFIVINLYNKLEVFRHLDESIGAKESHFPFTNASSGQKRCAVINLSEKLDTN